MSLLTKIGISVLATLSMTQATLAVCPVCTVAVGVGLGVSRWLGISDVIVATWIGALLASTSFWIFNFATKKEIKIKRLIEIIFIIFYAMAITTLWGLGIIGIPGNNIWGIDSFIFGIIIGTIVFIGAKLFYEASKAKRGKALFPFQKVIMPVAILGMISLVLHFLGF